MRFSIINRRKFDNWVIKKYNSNFVKKKYNSNSKKRKRQKVGFSARLNKRASLSFAEAAINKPAKASRLPFQAPPSIPLSSVQGKPHSQIGWFLNIVLRVICLKLVSTFDLINSSWRIMGKAKGEAARTKSRPSSSRFLRFLGFSFAFFNQFWMFWNSNQLFAWKIEKKN